MMYLRRALETYFKLINVWASFNCKMCISVMKITTVMSQAVGMHRGDGNEDGCLVCCPKVTKDGFIVDIAFHKRYDAYVCATQCWVCWTSY